MSQIKPYNRCKKCGAWIVSGDLCDDCNPMTNGDKIRSMTDEELAEWLTDGHEQCDFCAKHLCDFDSDCVHGVLKWLKQEVSEDAAY